MLVFVFVLVAAYLLLLIGIYRHVANRWQRAVQEIFPETYSARSSSDSGYTIFHGGYPGCIIGTGTSRTAVWKDVYENFIVPRWDRPLNDTRANTILRPTPI